MITTVAVDSAFDAVTLRAFAADGRSITVALPAGVTVGRRVANPLHPSGRMISDDPDVGSDNIRPGDLIMLTKGGRARWCRSRPSPLPPSPPR